MFIIRARDYTNNMSSYMFHYNDILYTGEFSGGHVTRVLLAGNELARGAGYSRNVRIKIITEHNREFFTCPGGVNGYPPGWYSLEVEARDKSRQYFFVSRFLSFFRAGCKKQAKKDEYTNLFFP